MLFSILELSITDVNLSVLRIFRLLRTLRPLRVIALNIEMKIVVTALLESIGAIFNVGIVLVIVWFMFAILGVSLFGGKFYKCEQENFDYKEDCEEYGYSWENSDTNFDNIL